MRLVVLCAVMLLLAGCASKSDDAPETTDSGPEDGGDEPIGGDEEPVLGQPTEGEPGYNQTWSEVLAHEYIEVIGSVATGEDQVEWVMSYPFDVEVPDDPSMTGLYLEIYWGSPTGGIVGGAAGLWVQDLPTTGVIEATTLAVASASGQSSGSAWLDAQDVWDAENPTFRAAAANGPHHAAYGTATVAVSAFFDGKPDGNYTALNG